MAAQAVASSAASKNNPHFHLVSGRVFFYLKVALVGGLFLGSPAIFYHIWKFIAPGLYKHEKRVLLPFAALASLCFFGGAIFCYYVVFPPAFRFLTGYSTAHLQVLPAVKEYFSLSLRLLIAFGLIFELPILMVFLAKVGIVNVAFLNRHRKYAILAAFVIAAIVTPTPDIVNQCLMAFPLLLLYEVSILAVWLFGKRKFGSFEKDSSEEQEGEGPVGN